MHPFSQCPYTNRYHTLWPSPTFNGPVGNRDFRFVISWNSIYIKMCFRRPPPRQHDTPCILLEVSRCCGKITCAVPVRFDRYGTTLVGCLALLHTHTHTSHGVLQLMIYRYLITRMSICVLKARCSCSTRFCKGLRRTHIYLEFDSCTTHNSQIIFIRPTNQRGSKLQRR